MLFRSENEKKGLMKAAKKKANHKKELEKITSKINDIDQIINQMMIQTSNNEKNRFGIWKKIIKSVFGKILSFYELFRQQFFECDENTLQGMKELAPILNI